MNQALTAEDLYTEMKRMPSTERVRFFSLLASNAFRSPRPHTCAAEWVYREKRLGF